MRRFDKKRKNKKVSNDEWESPTDPDSRITQMKDGRTHLAYKAEHVVDLESDLVLAAEIYPADQGDSRDAGRQRDAGAGELASGRERDRDRRGGGRQGLSRGGDVGTVRGPELSHVHSRAQAEAPLEVDRQAGRITGRVYANRRRVQGARSKRLQRLRSERVERSFAHVCETGGARRCWLHGLVKVAKRYLLQAAARNLGLILRKLFGMGTPRGLQKAGDSASVAYLLAVQVCCILLRFAWPVEAWGRRLPGQARPAANHVHRRLKHNFNGLLIGVSMIGRNMPS